MKKFNSNMIAVAMGLAFSVGLMAQTMTRDQYKSAKQVIAAEYKIAKSNCKSLAGNANDICKAEARGTDKVATAQLKAKYSPSENRAADYAVAKEKCDALAGAAKGNCIKDATARFGKS